MAPLANTGRGPSSPLPIETAHVTSSMETIPHASADEEPKVEREALNPSQETDGTLDSVEVSERKRGVRGFRWFLICVGIFSANLLYGLDTTIAADIQASVADTFDNVAQLGWLGVGFSLGSVVAILPVGKAYGVFDTKWTYVGCLVMFTAGSALCGAAPSMNAMIVGRVWAGAGGAGMYLGTLNLITSLCATKETGMYVGIISFVYGTGCILGPIVGGSFADSSATWRWAFYLNLVIFGAASPIYLFALPSIPHRPELATLQKIRNLDWLGVILTAALYVCLVLAFTFGGAIWAWSDGRVIALIVLFVFFAVVFGLTQYYSVFTNEIDRLFPLELLRIPAVIICYICTAGSGAVLFVAVYYIPLYYLFLHGDSGTQAAVRLLPFVCLFVAGTLACGYGLSRTGHAFAWYLACGLLFVAGGAAMYTVGPETQDAHIYGFSVMVGAGLAALNLSYELVPGLVKPDRIAEALQLMNIAQGQGLLLGLTIASCIFQSTAFDGLKVVLSPEGFSDAEIQGAVAGARSTLLRSIAPELRARCLAAIVKSIDYAWLLVIIAGAAQTLCALFMSKFMSEKRA